MPREIELPLAKIPTLCSTKKMSEDNTTQEGGGGNYFVVRPSETAHLTASGNDVSNTDDDQVSDILCSRVCLRDTLQQLIFMICFLPPSSQF